MRLAGLPSHRRPRLSSNVRPRSHRPCNASRECAFGVNQTATSAAKPRRAKGSSLPLRLRTGHFQVFKQPKTSAGRCFTKRTAQPQATNSQPARSHALAVLWPKSTSRQAPACPSLHSASPPKHLGTRRCSSPPGRGLTPRSTRGPTAGRQARAAPRRTMRCAGLPSHRRPRVTSNVRPRRKPLARIAVLLNSQVMASASFQRPRPLKDDGAFFCSRSQAAPANVYHGVRGAHVLRHSRDLPVRACRQLRVLRAR